MLTTYIRLIRLRLYGYCLEKVVKKKSCWANRTRYSSDVTVIACICGVRVVDECLKK